MSRPRGESGAGTAKRGAATWLVEGTRQLEAQTETAAYAMGAAAPTGDADAWAAGAGGSRTAQPAFLIQSQDKRLQQFNFNCRAFKKKALDRYIAGYKPREETVPYLISIPKVEGLDLEQARSLAKVSLEGADSITVEYHMTLFYRNMGATREDRQMFFFGRTAKSRPIPLKKGSGATKYAATEEEHVFLHTSLDRPELSDSVFLVLECVITVSAGAKKRQEPRKGKQPDKVVVSGGYIAEPLFKLARNLGQPSVRELLAGTPRELAAVIDDSLSKASKRKAGPERGKISLALTRHKGFAELSQLVPDNCLVSLRDMVPGLSHPAKNRAMLLPKPEFRKEKDKKG